MDEQKRTEIHLDGETNHDHHDGIFPRKVRSGYTYDSVTGERDERPTVTLVRYESPTKATSLSGLVDELGAELETYEPSHGTYADATAGEFKKLAGNLKHLNAFLDQLDEPTSTRVETTMLFLYKLGCWAERMRVEGRAPAAKRGDAAKIGTSDGGTNSRRIKDKPEQARIRPRVEALMDGDVTFNDATTRISKAVTREISREDPTAKPVSARSIQRICNGKLTPDDQAAIRDRVASLRADGRSVDDAAKEVALQYDVISRSIHQICAENPRQH
jgi:hypothetical protein